MVGSDRGFEFRGRQLPGARGKFKFGFSLYLTCLGNRFICMKHGTVDRQSPKAQRRSLFSSRRGAMKAADPRIFDLPADGDFQTRQIGRPLRPRRPTLTGIKAAVGDSSSRQLLVSNYRYSIFFFFLHLILVVLLPFGILIVQKRWRVLFLWCSGLSRIAEPGPGTTICSLRTPAAAAAATVRCSPSTRRLVAITCPGSSDWTRRQGSCVGGLPVRRRSPSTSGRMGRLATRAASVERLLHRDGNRTCYPGSDFLFER